MTDKYECKNPIICVNVFYTCVCMQMNTHTHTQSLHELFSSGLAMLPPRAKDDPNKNLNTRKKKSSSSC